MSYPDSDENNQVNNEEIAAKKELVLKQILSSDARLRLNNVRMVKPEIANMVENYLINMASQGHVTKPITDDQLKQILQSIQQPKREFKINRR
jgi:programmed cell death protein 5